MLRKNVLSVRMLMILAFCVSFTTLAAQDNKAEKIEIKPNHNVAYASLTAGVNANYERLLYSASENSFFKSYWAKIGYGIFTIPFSGYYGYTHLGLTALSGARNAHFELNLGVASFFDLYYYSERQRRDVVRSDYRDIFPSGSIGYRFQKPEGGFVFRAGAGFPEIVYLSAGYSF